MEWINTEDQHFVEIIYFDDGRYMWMANENYPDEPILVGLWVIDTITNKKTFETHLVILTENGLEEWTEEDTYPLDSWEVIDIEYWCKIEPPIK